MASYSSFPEIIRTHRVKNSELCKKMLLISIFKDAISALMVLSISKALLLQVNFFYTN
jgi:hypothetical protein